MTRRFNEEKQSKTREFYETVHISSEITLVEEQAMPSDEASEALVQDNNGEQQVS